MKRKSHLWMIGAVVAIGIITSAWAQEADNLAQYARQKRQEKQSEPAPKKLFDNDNLPREEHISVVGNQRDEAAPTTAVRLTRIAPTLLPAPISPKMRTAREPTRPIPRKPSLK